MSLTKRLTGPYGLTRQDPSVEKASAGGSLLYELENYLIDQGVLSTREGLTRLSADALETVSGTATAGSSGSDLRDATALQFTSDMVGCVITNTTDASTGVVTAYTSTSRITAALSGGTDNSWTSGDAYVIAYPILALHRFYGLNQNTGAEIKELYCAVKDKLKRWSGSAWVDFYMPPGVTLTRNVKGTFEQVKDRTYYSNGVDPVLCIKKDDLQVYEAGIPDPNREVVIDDCESDTAWTLAGVPASGPGAYDTNKCRKFPDAGFDRHTKGDYGITIEASDSAADNSKYVTLTKTLSSALDLTWFFKTLSSGTVAATSSGGTKLVATSSVFTAGMVGQQVKNNTDGSTSVIVQYVSGTEVLTSELAGGTDNTWTSTDTFTVGEPSSEQDYIAIDIFRFTKIDIDEVTLELATDSGFSNSYSATIYTDSDFSYTGHQRTLLAQWAMNARSNMLFLARFRKEWFAKTGSPSWASIRYIRIKLRKNHQTTGTGTARITIDNIRLLKTPPLPAEVKLQIATCDQQETWTGAGVIDDYIRATQGQSCKYIPTGVTAAYDWAGTRDFSQYDAGTEIGTGDVLAFDICGTGTEVITSWLVRFIFWDNAATPRRAIGTSTLFENLKQPRKRSILIQDFEYPGTAGGASVGSFDWENVTMMQIQNVSGGAGWPGCYIDNIRIEPAVASKMIDNFIPMDLIALNAAEEVVDYVFRENPLVDRVTDWLFQEWVEKSRQAAGQGAIVYPEWKHGRYKMGDYTMPSLQLMAEAGGAFSATFTAKTDLTEYEDARFNLQAFFHPQDYKDSLWGVKWSEIPATGNDKLSVWISTPDTTAIKKIIFKFFCNKYAEWNSDTTGTHTASSGTKYLEDTSATFTASMLYKRIKNVTKSTIGIITMVIPASDRLSAYNNAGIMTWDAGDQYEVEGWTIGNSGIQVADPDNYYEYEIDFETMFSNLEGVVKNLNKAIGRIETSKGKVNPIEEYFSIRDTSVDYKQVKEKTAAANADYIELYRQIAEEYGVSLVYQDVDAEGDKWWQGVVSWKRDDMTSHLTDETQSMQNICAYKITLVAKNKKAICNFQDLQMERVGPIKGDVMYKVVLEDEQGWLGPASDASKRVNVDGASVNLSDIYVPYDTRIARKRIYRTDSTGVFRYVDTIDRTCTSYLDEIPEELLGETIEPDYHKPPRASIMRKVDNKMAYARVIDRNGRYKPSTIYISEAFAPHRCSDFNIFDVLPDDGQRITGIEWYYGTYLVWKENSFFTVDPENYRYIPRDR